ncbi:MAG: hypothetical protein JNK76_26095 [Planctomycetales bacterium]|nr:hypothetical protein [Planctomycetales bacterium]
MVPQPSPLLVLDEDREFCETVARRFQRRGFTVRMGAKVGDIPPLGDGQRFEICFLRLGLQTEAALFMLRDAGLLAPQCQIILLTTREQLENASDTIPAMTADCLAKPLIWAELDWRVMRAQERAQTNTLYAPPGGESFAQRDGATGVFAPQSKTDEAAKQDSLATVQRAHIVEVLRREEGNKARTARALGVNRRSLYRLIEKFKIDLESPADKS